MLGAEIYLQVIRDFPGRFKMFYIREVDPASHQKVLKIAKEIGKLRIEMMLITNTIEAIHHADSKGWILEEDIALIVEEKKEDEKVAKPLI